MKECLVTEINVSNEKFFFTCFYRLLSQSHGKLENFCSNVDLLFSYVKDQGPVCSIVIGNFNLKCSSSCTTDKNNTTGLTLGSITTTTG